MENEDNQHLDQFAEVREGSHEWFVFAVHQKGGKVWLVSYPVLLRPGAHGTMAESISNTKGVMH